MGTNYHHVYEGRSNLFDEVISEEDEDQRDEDSPSRAFMWSEAVAPIEEDINRSAGLSILQTSKMNLTKRSRSESDLAKILEKDFGNSGRVLLQRLPPASARKIESSAGGKLQKNNLESKSFDQNRTKVLGSVGHLLATFRRQETIL